MYDPRNPNGPPPPTNGYPAWPQPSIAELLLSEMRAFRSDHMDMREDLGALKEGMRRSLNNDAEIFQVLRTHGDRMSAAERDHRHLHQAHRTLAEEVKAGPPLTDKQGLLASILDLFPSSGRLRAAIMVYFLMALGVAVAPETTRTLLDLLGAVN